MTNILQAKGLTAFSNVDYDTLKEWDENFTLRFKDIDTGPGTGMTEEQVFNYGASLILSDVIAMIENPSHETVQAFKKLTAPSVNVKTIVVVAVVASAWWLTPRVINRSRLGSAEYRRRAMRGTEGWRGLLR